MGKIEFKLVEQSSDLRSKEVAYNFTVENHGLNAIKLFTITPRVPDGVSIVDVKDPSTVEVKSKHAAICSELTALLDDFLTITSKELPDKLATIYSDMYDKILGQRGGVFTMYLSIFRGTYVRNLVKSRHHEDSLKYTIETAQDASLVLKRFIEPVNGQEIIKEVFKIKTEKLVAMESSFGADMRTSAIATIEPDSFFTYTYLFQCPRRLLNSTRYNIAIEVTYGDPTSSPTPTRMVGGASTSITISPNPVLTTVIAVLGAMLGVMLKRMMDPALVDSNQPENMQLYSDMGFMLMGAPGLSAIILAILFFNIYEFTDIGKRILFGVSWRGALIIGALCGLLGDRVLTALKILLGSGS